MYRTYLLLVISFAVSSILAQERLLSPYSVLERQQEILSMEPDRDRETAVEFARRNRLPVRIVNKDGSVMEIKRLSPTGMPQYIKTTNLTSAESISTDEVWAGGEAGLALDGDGIVVGVWDGGTVLISHQEFGGRARILDGANDPIDHATHVAGTIGAEGRRPNARGMAGSSIIDSYDWNNDNTEIRNAAENGLLISNHSYGFVHGWNFDSDLNRWEWYGDTDISEAEDYGFGFYGVDARIWDEVMHDHPRYQIVKSAGNDRGEGPAPGTSHWVFDGGSWKQSSTPRERDGGSDGYDAVGTQGTSKNILTIGAVNDIPGGYESPSDVRVASFSAFGPTDDGRIKPDLVANGIGLFSPTSGNTTDYGFIGGTSMSAPSVAGSLALLQQHHQAVRGNSMYSSQLRALVFHTADEAGNPGPDYIHGWGLMNTRRAADLITTLPDDRFLHATLTDQEAIEYVFFSRGAESIRVTMAWTDPAGRVPQVALDPKDKILINDLDMTLTRQVDNHVFLPYTLDPANPSKSAQTGNNAVDNSEQIYIDMPAPGFYTLRVSHKGALQGGAQDYALVVTGLDKDFVATGKNILEENNGSVLLSSADEYPNNMFVEWVIQPGNDKAVQFYFDWFDTEEGDSLTIYDGSDSLSPVLAVFRGSLTNIDTLISASTDSLYLVFSSDEQDSGRGFLARYCTVAPEGDFNISGDMFPCTLSESPYFALGQDGAYFRWESVNGWTIKEKSGNGIDLSIGENQEMLRLEPFNRCGEGNNSSLSISPLVTAPVLSQVTGDSLPCAGSSAFLVAEPLPGVTYHWDLPENWVGTSQSDTLYYIPGQTSGTIQVSGSNACGIGNQISKTILVEDVPSRVAILTDKNPPCALTVQDFFVDELPDHTYRWNVQDDWNIVGSDSSSTVTVEVGESQSFLFVTSINKCGLRESNRLFLTSPVPPEARLVKYDGDLGLPQLEVTNLQEFESIQWYREGVMIPAPAGITNPLVANLNGRYWAESISREGCRNGSEGLTFMEVDRNSLAFRAYRSLGHQLIVESTYAGTATLQIIDLNGRAVYNDMLDGEGVFEIPFIGQGVYLLRFTAPGLDQKYKVLL